MAKVTWLGEEGGPDETTRWNILFKKGHAVEVGDEGLLFKLSGNKFFKVEEEKAEVKGATNPPVRKF